MDRRIRLLHADSGWPIWLPQPNSGKSYVHLEYEYALDKKKPYFTLLMDDAAFNRRVKSHGIDVDKGGITKSTSDQEPGEGAALWILGRSKRHK